MLSAREKAEMERLDMVTRMMEAEDPEIRSETIVHKPINPLDRKQRTSRIRGDEVQRLKLRMFLSELRGYIFGPRTGFTQGELRIQ
jgi:hypothetical protein